MSLSDISSKFTTTTLDEIIRKAGGTKHVSFKFGKGFKKGDSYLSKVFRLCVNGINETNGSEVVVNLIIKGMPENMARRKVFRSVEFFRNEINFYQNVIPAWEKFQEKQKPKNPFTDYPICYAALCDGENDFIALEDVTFLGYSAPNRQSCISLEECLLTMRTLGRYHGISLALRNLDSAAFETAANTLQETYYSEKQRTWYCDFLKLACYAAQDAVSKTYPNTKYEEISQNFLQANKLYDELIRSVSSKSKLLTFGHGDCWTPNFLTKYSEDNIPEGIKIIDFQLARTSSIVLDITFFIYSCTDQDLREKNYDNLLQEYIKSARDIITDLGANADEILTWNDLSEELKRFGYFGCGMGIESLPATLVDDDDVVDLDDITENTVLVDVWNVQPFTDVKKRERIAQIFKHAIDQGYIN